MNKISTYIVAGALSLTCGACGDTWLNLEPDTYVQTDEAVSSLSDVYYVINGAYNTLQNAYAYSGRFIYYGDVTGDDLQAYSSSKRTGSAYLFNYTKDTSPNTYWEYPYNVITMCNVVLEQISGIEIDDEELADYYQGQAYALRGMMLFELTRFYGYPYNKDNGASLGACIINEVLDKDAKPARSTVAECYTQIISDLTKAIALMDNDEGNSYHKGWVSRYGVMSLLSRVYLYHNEPAAALSMAKEAISEAEAAGYALWSNSEYATAWTYDPSSTSPGEVLFEIVNTTEDSPGKEAMGYLYYSSGYKDAILTTSFYNLLFDDSNDVRTKLITVSSKRAYLIKFQPQDGEETYDANIPVLRLSETYLNAAEAAYKTGDNTAALTYLNVIVSRANPSNEVSADELNLDRILTERRKELMGEGHRMYDALRDGGYVYRHDETASKISSTKHLTSNEQKLYFNWDYFKCVLAIPTDEMDANPNMVQNPSYDAEEE